MIWTPYIRVEREPNKLLSPHCAAHNCDFDVPDSHRGGQSISKSNWCLTYGFVYLSSSTRLHVLSERKVWKQLGDGKRDKEKFRDN